MYRCIFKASSKPVHLEHKIHTKHLQYIVQLQVCKYVSLKYTVKMYIWSTQYNCTYSALIRTVPPWPSGTLYNVHPQPLVQLYLCSTWYTCTSSALSISVPLPPSVQPYLYSTQLNCTSAALCSTVVPLKPRVNLYLLSAPLRAVWAFLAPGGSFSGPQWQLPDRQSGTGRATSSRSGGLWLWASWGCRWWMSWTNNGKYEVVVWNKFP